MTFTNFPKLFIARKDVDFALLWWGISTLCLSQVVSRAVRGYAFASSSLGCTVLTTTSNGRSKPSILQFQQCALPCAYIHTTLCCNGNNAITALESLIFYCVTQIDASRVETTSKLFLSQSFILSCTRGWWKTKTKRQKQLIPCKSKLSFTFFYKMGV